MGTVSLGANPMHTIKTLLEAEKHNGPSIIICYAPCIAHGIKTGMKDSLLEEKLVTNSGYFPLMSYNPETKKFTLKYNAKSSAFNPDVDTLNSTFMLVWTEKEP